MFNIMNFALFIELGVATNMVSIRQAILLTRVLEKYRLDNANSLDNLLKVNDVSLWWFVDSRIFSIMLKNELRSVKRIVLYKLARHYRLLLTLSILRYFSIILFISFLRIVLNLINIVLRKRHFRNSCTNSIIFTTQYADWRYVIRLYHNKIIYGKDDAMLGSLMNSLADRSICCIAVYPLFAYQYSPKSWLRSLKSYIEKVAIWNFRMYAPEEYADIRALKLRLMTIKYLFNLHKRVLEAGTKLGQTDAINKLVDIIYWSVLLHYVPLALEYFVYNIVLLHKMKPCVVVLVNEYGLWERSLILAAKQIFVPTVAIQHGIIHEYHRGYIYWEDEDPLLPDWLIVYDDEFKDVIVRTNKKISSRVLSLGHLKLESYAQLLDSINNSNARQRHRMTILYLADKNIISKISRDSFILLWTTQTHAFDSKTAEQYIREVCSAVREATTLSGKHIVVLVKPHPGEVGTEKLYTKISEEIGCNITVLPKTSDVYMLMLAADALLTFNSTTAMEFKMLTCKPVVVYNPFNDPVAKWYVQKGIAIEAKDTNELARILTCIVDQNCWHYNVDSVKDNMQNTNSCMQWSRSTAISRISQFLINVCRNNGKNTA